MKLDEIICDQLAQDTSWPLQGMAPRLIRLRRSVTELEQRLSSLERSVEAEDLRQLVLAASSDQLDQENGIDKEWPERTRGEERSRTAPSTPRRRPDRKAWQGVESDEEDSYDAVSPRNGDLEDELITDSQIFNEISPKKKFNDKKSDGRSNYMNGRSIEKNHHQNSSKYDYFDHNISNKSYANKKTLGDITVCEAALEELLNEQGLIEHEIELSKPQSVSENSSKKNVFSKKRCSRNSLDDPIQGSLSRVELRGEKQKSPPTTSTCNPTPARQGADRRPTKLVEKKNQSGKIQKLNNKSAIKPNKIQNKNDYAPHKIGSSKLPIDDKTRKSAVPEETELSNRVTKSTNIPCNSGDRNKNFAASKSTTGTSQSKNGSGKNKVSISSTKMNDRMQESSTKLIQEDACQQTKKAVGERKCVITAKTTTSACMKVNSTEVTAKPARATVAGVASKNSGGRGRGKADRKGKKKPKQMQFHINCEQPAKDEIFDVNDFEAFLKAKIKVEGRVNNLSRAVTITSAGTKITITTRDLTFSKRYLKYLSKKYLQKKGLRDWLRVVSPGASAGDSYELRYYKFTGLEDSEDEES